MGLGLIGGSIAKTIKKKNPEVKLFATASGEKTVIAAYQDKVIENDKLLTPEEIASSDVIFLCSPVKVNVDYLKLLKPHLKEGTLITDVGSVKGDIEKAVDEEGLSDRFIGGHPMAGSERTGFEYSTDHLLENVYYILTVNPHIDSRKVDEFQEFISSLDAIPLTMSPEEHDFATAAISHLPHVISASLVNLVRKTDNEDNVLKTIAAGGFKDITRISSSSPVMWEHICLTNKDKILELISLYEDELNEFKERIMAENGEGINSLFREAKDYRDSLPVKKKGIIPAAYAINIDVADEVGGIAMIATLLAFNDISIKNVGIVHNREFEQGALRIEFYDDESMVKAEKVLKERNYTIYSRDN